MNSKSMAGWIGFAGILMLIIGSIDFFQGLIALFEDEYFVVTAVWLPRRRPDGMGLDHVDLGRAARSRRPRAGRRAGVGALVCDRGRVRELHRPTRLPRQQPVPALVADCDGAERDRALRADRALERERGGAQPHSLPSSPGSRPSRATSCATASPSRRRATCSPGRAQGRGVRRLVRVLVLDRGHLEARVLERRTDIRVRVEVLAVLLAEGLPVTGPRELDPGVARAGAGIHDTADHEVVSRRLTRDRWGWRW